MRHYKVFFTIDIDGRFLSDFTFRDAASQKEAEDDVLEGLKQNYPFGTVLGVSAVHWNS